MKFYKYALLFIIVIVFSNTSFSQSLNVDFTGTQELCVFTEATFTNQSTAGNSPIIEYSWNFGDGSSSTAANPTHTYTIPGTYTVTLVVQTANGGAGSEVKSNYVVVHPKPQANFETSISGCNVPVNVTFTNSSVGGQEYDWDFGNGEYSNQATPSVITYTSEGTYTVSLIVTNAFGCEDIIEKPIDISSFQSDIIVPDKICAGSSANIIDNSTPGANTWNWDFPGGSPISSANQNPTVRYDTPGNYTISLTSQNTNSGCVSSESKSITVLPKPTASFTNNPSEGCAPQNIKFNNTGTQAGASYEWDFGNGNTSTSTSPTTTYASNGVYTVRLIMTDANGCVDTVVHQAVTLAKPEADFSSNVINGCADLDVQFTDNSTSLDPIASWQWNYGDGTTHSGKNPPVHTYPSGIYDVTLIVTTQSGCQDTIIKPAYIQVGQIDDLDFSLFESPQCVKTNIDFTSSVDISVPHDQSEIVYNWDFGNGDTSQERDPTYPYVSDTGYFDITLIVNFRGCEDTIIKEKEVYIKAPLAEFDVNTTLFCNPGSFPVTLETDDNAILGRITDSYEMIWKWGDNTPPTNINKTDLDNAGNGDYSHQYNDYGTYLVEQVIHNHTTGCSDSVSHTIYVSRTEAVIDPFIIDSVCVGSPFQMAENSTSTHSFGSYSWDMGDNSTVSGATPTHTYQSHGDYTIELTATNSVGCSGVTTYSPFTALALPVADLNADNQKGCPPFEVTFTNESTVTGNGVPLSSFVFSYSDDGTTDATTSPLTDVTHTFSSVGVYQVSLVATDQFGCISAPTAIEIQVVKPTASFTIDTIVCANQDVLALNTSFGDNPLSYEWFLDGTPTNQDQNYTTSHTGNSGTPSTSVEYTLIVTDNNGCKDTVIQNITISTPIPDADISLSGAATNSLGEYTCPPVFADFTNQSQSDGAIVDYNWTFSDGKSSILENPSNSYVYPGAYSYTLTITDEYGCTGDTTFQNFLTVLGPSGTPSWNQIAGECNQNVYFNLKDTSNVSGITWDFGDSKYKEGGLDLEHYYTGHGYFYPSVTLTDDNNCAVTYLMDTLFIEDFGVTADFNINPPEAELGQVIVITDQSSSSNSTIENWTWLIDGYDPISNNTGDTPDISYLQSGYYDVTLIVVNNYGCVDTLTMKAHVTKDFTMPNVFTPNGDGDNDYFTLKYGIFKSFDLVILNRWGNPIVDKKGLTGINLWDGRTRNGEMCTDGVYFYKINGTLLDGTPGKAHGYFHLLDGKQ